VRLQALGQAREVLGRSPTGPLLLYDARCSVCRRFVTLVVHADRSGKIRIAPLVGPYGDALRRTHPVFGARESAVWIPRNGPALAQSDAILAVLHHLGGGWRWLAALGAVIPRSFRNAAYRWFAQHRRWFSWFGLRDLDTTVRARLLEDSVSENWYDYRR
jgi:predicted DCC family thiol-disulfide oxidoreductase YuxK